MSSPSDALLTTTDSFSSVNEIFDPERVDPFFALPADVRKAQIAADQATNYAVVRLELLEHIYNVMYRQKLHNPDENTWAHRIFTHNEVQEVVERPNGKVDLKLKALRGAQAVSETLDGYDLVVFGTGYYRNMHRQLLKEVEGLFASPDCSVDRRYKVQMKQGAVARDAGIWLQGACESTHGLSDSLLSILAVRGGQMVDSIFEEQIEKAAPAMIQARL